MTEASESPELIRAQLKDVASPLIPSGEILARNAIDEVIRGHEDDRPWLKQNASLVIELAQWRAFDSYLEHEAAAGGHAVQQVFSELAGPNASAEEALGLVAMHFKGIDLFALGLAQGRKSRAGNAFDLVVRDLLTRLGYLHSRQVRIAGRTDLVLPSTAHYEKNPLDTIIVALKRTLRERWKQVVTEGRNALGIYLATIDRDVRPEALAEMMLHKIRLVVPAKAKSDIPAYASAPNVISYEDFFLGHLDPAMARWNEGK